MQKHAINWNSLQTFYYISVINLSLIFYAVYVAINIQENVRKHKKQKNIWLQV